MLTSFKRSRLTVAALGVASALVLAGCGSDPKPASGSNSGSGGGAASKTIAFSPLGLKIPAMQDLAKGVQGYGKSKGYTINVQDPGLDPQKQLTQLQSLIGNGSVGGAWVISVSPSALSSLIPAAQKKKIALLLNGEPKDYGLDGMQAGVTFDKIDYAAEGDAVGSALGACINEKLGGKAQVLFGEASPGTAGKADYENAVKAALKKTAPDAKIVSTITITDRAKAQTDVGNALQGHPGINAVFGQNDEGALGTLGAFASAGKKLPCLTEGGGNAEALAKVKSGEIYAIAALQFAGDMVQSFDTLAAMMKDPTAPGKQLTVPMKVIKAGS